MSSEDGIEKLLKRYSDLAEEEHRELFWKHEGARTFICYQCGKMKIQASSGVRFYRLDKTILYFCNQKCWVKWLKKNPKITWKYDSKRFGGKSWRNPIETSNVPLPLSEFEKTESDASKKA